MEPIKILHSGGEDSIFSIMSDRIENKHTGVGVPSDIYRHDRPLNSRQQRLLDALPEYDCRVVVGKDDVSMTDLSALTAKEGVEFAMFTRGQERLVVRGDARHVNINGNDAAKLNAQGYKWSGHTHTGDKKMHLLHSYGDLVVLGEFKQPESVIYNSVGEFRTFGKLKTGGGDEM